MKVNLRKDFLLINPGLSFFDLRDLGVFTRGEYISLVARNAHSSTMSRIILMKSISKIMTVCHLLIVSEGWSKLLGLPGVVAVTLTSVCKLCVDVSTMITGKDGFVLFCEITMITGNAVYLMGILLITHKRKANYG